MAFLKGHKGYWLGKEKPHTDEEKKNISKGLVGHKISNETKKLISDRNKGQVAWNKGKSWSKEIKDKISLTNKIKGIEPKIKFMGKGKDSPNWKGGITPENKKIRSSIEYRLWREAVFARDNWTCQECGEKGCYLEAHHIKRFVDCPELRTSIENGITLCRECHKLKRSKHE